MIQLTDSIERDPIEVASFLELPTPEFFDYEYKRYLPAQSVFIQARADDRLVGTQALIPYPLVVSGQRIVAGRSERTRVDSSMRGGTLFPQLMERCAQGGLEKGLQFIWGTTILKTALERVGFRFFDDFYEHALMCLSPARAVRDLRAPQPNKLRAAKLLALAPSAIVSSVAKLAQSSQLDIRATPRDYDDIFHLYERLRAAQPLVAIDQNERFTHWLLDESGREVARYYGYRGAELAAYAYVDVSEGTTANMIDFAAADHAALAGLVRSIARDLKNRGVAFLRTAYNVRNPFLRRLRGFLIRSGFIPVFRGGGFVLRPLHFTDASYLNDLSRWYITGVWFQLYRGS